MRTLTFRIAMFSVRDQRMRVKMMVKIKMGANEVKPRFKATKAGSCVIEENRLKKERRNRRKMKKESLLMRERTEGGVIC